MKRVLDIYGCDTRYTNDAPKENVLINQMLPIELIQKILMNLKDADMPTAQQVCHYWKQRIRCIASNNILEIGSYVNFLNKNLQITYTDEVAAFYRFNDSVSPLLALIDSDKKVLHFKEFISLRNVVKRNFFNLLMTKSPRELNKIRDASINELGSTQFEHVFNLAQTHKDIETMDKSADAEEKSSMRKNICIDLAKAFAESDMVTTVPRIFRSVSCKSIYRHGITRNEIKSTLESIIWGAELSERNTLIKDASMDLVLYGEIETALSLVAHMTGAMNQDSAYEDFSMLLASKGKSDEALKFANEIKDDKIRDSAYATIFASTEASYQKK